MARPVREIKFTGTLSDVQRQLERWKADHPDDKIVDTGPPIRVGYADGEDVFDKDDWSVTIRYRAE